jgi:hypothetical protein
MKAFYHLIILVSLSLTLLACSATPEQEQQINTQDITNLPSFLTSLEDSKLTATLKVYDAEANVVLKQDLDITDNKVTSTPFTLENNKTFTFVIVFYYQVSTESTLPIAYVLLSQSIDNQETEIYFVEESYIYEDPNSENNISVDWNLNSYGIPALDSDGDGIANLIEILQETDPFTPNNNDGEEEVVILDDEEEEEEESTQRYYSDSDGDGYGISSDYIDAIATTGNYTTTVAGDCNDNSYTIYPQAFEGCANDDIDNDCDGSTTDGFLCADYTYSDMLALATVLRGDDSYDYVGGYVLPVGDVNGDNFTDIIIGAHRDDEETDSGSVFVYYGETDFEFASANSTRFIGESGYDNLGVRMSYLGDLNKDGFDDVFMGAYRHDGEEISNTGASYIYYGGSNLGATVYLSDADYALKFIGESEDDEATVNNHASGDVNGDGELDLLMSSSNRDDDNLSNNGAAYLYYGPFSEGSVNLSQSMSTRAKFIGPENDSYFTYRTSIDGDLNGDGYTDVMITARSENVGGQSGSGAVYLYYGPIESGEHRTTSATIRFTGENTDDNAGNDATMNCDINNDGYHDILMGAPNNNDNGSHSGKVYLFFGPITAEGNTREISLSSADVVFLGENTGDNAGVSLACDRDINNDGFDDILIGAYMNSNDGHGKAYLIHGREINHFNSSVSLEEADISFIGTESDSLFGKTLSFAGDVNADGYEEILISAYYEDNGDLTNAGAAYLITISE